MKHLLLINIKKEINKYMANFIKLTCESCGGEIELKNTQVTVVHNKATLINEIYFCSHCGTKYTKNHEFTIPNDSQQVININGNINTEGGAMILGNINIDNGGDFIGRNQIVINSEGLGDKVTGNKVSINLNNQEDLSDEQIQLLINNARAKRKGINIIL